MYIIMEQPEGREKREEERKEGKRRQEI